MELVAVMIAIRQKNLVGIIVKAEVGQQFLKPASFLAGFCPRDKQLKASMQKSLWGKLLTGQESGSKLMGLWGQ